MEKFIMIKEDAINQTVYKIAQMDCPTEEQIIRMKLQSVQGIARLDFNLENRTVMVFHSSDVALITNAINETGFNAEVLNSTSVSPGEPISHTEQFSERKMLYYVLAINAFFFIFEIIAGILSNSMGLIADSLDMFADAIVYSLSLMVIGKAISRKKQVATVSGYFQLILAVTGFMEVVKRFFGFGEVPIFQSMVAVSLLALIGNVSSLMILRKARNGEAHLKASWIFTTNDVIINIGVIVAGILVYFTHSRIPDLIVGGIIFIIVMRGSFNILRIGRD
jgi:Co/Zn/Cd efflux system component/copper chaperone CopZ